MRLTILRLATQPYMQFNFGSKLWTVYGYTFQITNMTNNNANYLLN